MSDSDSEGVDEGDSNTEFPSPVKRWCYATRSGRSVSSFAFCRITTNRNVNFRTDSFLCNDSQYYNIVNKSLKLISAERTITEGKGAISCTCILFSVPSSNPLHASFSSLPSLRVKQKRLLQRREEHGIMNKASIRVSLFVFNH